MTPVGLCWMSFMKKDRPNHGNENVEERAAMALLFDFGTHFYWVIPLHVRS